MRQDIDVNHVSANQDDPNLMPVPAAAKATVAFCYHDHPDLTPKEIQTLRDSADDVRRLTGECAARILQTGQVLTLAKALLGHGRFGPWLASETNHSERTAQRAMQAFAVFGAKNDTVSGLEPTAVYELSAPSTPEPVRAALVARIERGEQPPLAEIKAEVAAARKVETTKRALKRSVRYGVPLTPSGTIRARTLARFIKEQLGERYEKLAPMLAGVDPVVLLALLRDPDSLRPQPPTVVAEL